MLYGERVTLRALTPDDYPRLMEFKNDTEFVLLADGSPPKARSLPQITEFFDDLVKQQDNLGFAIEVDGKFIGDCGLFHVNWVDRTAEVGIGIGDHDYWGKGYGREALRLIVNYGFGIQNLRRIWLETSANNPRAIRSYLAVGFVEEGRQREHSWVNGEYIDNVLMGLLRADFKGLPS